MTRALAFDLTTLLRGMPDAGAAGPPPARDCPCRERAHLAPRGDGVDADPDADADGFGELRALLPAFERTGGFVDVEGPRAACAGESRAVSFMLDERLCVPAFQFVDGEPQPCAGVRAVIAELRGTLADEELACWFARANSWLGGLAPAEMVRCAPDAVLQAARADRFISRF